MLEEVTDPHEVIHLGDILLLGVREDEDLPVIGDLEVAVGLFLDLTELAEQRVHVMPAQVVGNGMLENRVEGAQVRAGKRGRGRHVG